MRRFAELLERLAFTPSRNAKLRLITGYLRATVDPDRGWALAAITRDISVESVKPAMLRALTAERVLARRLEAGLELVGLDRVAEGRHLARDVAELLHHRVGRKVRVDLVGGRELRRATRDALEDALRRLL